MRALNYAALGPVQPFVVLLSTGQSLSIGFPQTAVSTSQPYSNLKIHDSSGTYDITLPNAGTLSLVPLVTPLRSSGNSATPYPNNLYGESVETSFANQLAALDGASQPVGAEGVGQGGAPMSVIQKSGSGNAYAAGLYAIRVFKRLAPGGKPVVVPFVALTHGEADSQAQNTSYGTQLATLQSNYQTDIPAITGQTTTTLPLIFSQQHQEPAALAGGNLANTAMYNFAKASPTLAILSGPKYQSAWFSDHLHITEYRPIGEKMAQAGASWLANGSWSPFWPTAATGSGTSTVTLTCHVPVGPIVKDTSLGNPHQAGTRFAMWANGGGLEVWDNPMTVAGATGNGANAVVQLSAPIPAGVVSGVQVSFNDIGGNTNCNGVFYVSVVDSTHLALFSDAGLTTPIVGNGTYIQDVLPAVAFTPVTINSVTISGSQLIIALGRTLQTSPHVGYAENSDRAFGTACGGFPDGRCGCYRDSDPFTGLSGIANPNWLVEFTMAVS